MEKYRRCRISRIYIYLKKIVVSEVSVNKNWNFVEKYDIVKEIGEVL